MDSRFGRFFLLISLLLVLLGAASRSSAARHFALEFAGGAGKPSDVSNSQVCLLCEEYAAEALDYLSQNKTQTQVIDLLHQSCSRLPSFKQQCITLVDYYAPLFFLEASSVDPDQFCRKLSFCQDLLPVAEEFQEDSCGICHRAVSELLVKLKDPNNQLEIIQVLLKGCKSMENYAAKCKKMVFEYGPIILANAEQYLETTDICTTLHACDSAMDSKKQELQVVRADS